MAQALDFVLMRGGTSKGVFLRASDVPDNREALSRLLLNIFGSPDHRQIDGLGGADKLTSKAAIVGPSAREEADVDYLFAQVGIDNDRVEYGLNCGNLAAAVGLHALQAGLVTCTGDVTGVRIWSVNSDRMFIAHVQCRDGQPVETGDCAIAGVPGTAAPIQLDFSQAEGAITGQLLPLGDVASWIDLPGGHVQVSVVDCGNCVVFIPVEAIGLTGRETPDEIDGNPAALRLIHEIRRAVAHRAGLGAAFDAAKAPANPIAVFFAPAGPGEDCDIHARIWANGMTSKAYAGTVTACTGVAARMAGTVLHGSLSPQIHAAETLRIRHPGGVIGVKAGFDAQQGRVTRAEITRTARRIAEGRTFLRPAGREERE
ncbi:MAG: PrpF domain-containing protein [Pararhodobacter sp.]